MATQPEPLRLFDPGRLDDEPSPHETERRVADRDAPMPSRVRTRREASRSKTTPAVPADVHVGTPPDPSDIETHHRERRGPSPDNDLLREAAEAARLVTLTTDALNAAITAARAAGRSWRELGIAAGIPFQTLHRRAKLADTHPEPPGQEDP